MTTTIAGHEAEEGSEAARYLLAARAYLFTLCGVDDGAFGHDACNRRAAAVCIEFAIVAPGYVGPAPTTKENE